jgi:hypothetical protein
MAKAGTVPTQQMCPDCGHDRKVHSRKGCLDNGMCDRGCKKTYMDLSPRK